MRSFRLAAVVALTAGLASAEVDVVEEIIAKVNTDVILRSDLEDSLATIQAEVVRNDQIPDEQKQAVIEQRAADALRDLIDERLLVQRGKDMGVNVEGQLLRYRDDLMKRNNLQTVDEFERWVTEAAGMPVEDLMERMRDQMISQTVLGQEVGGSIFVSKEEIEAYYQEHKDEFVRKEGVRLSEILISKEGKAGAEAAEAEKKSREVFDRVQKGEPFAEMARRFSDSEVSKENGGDIGIWRRGVLDASIEERVFSLNPGDTTDLIETPRGWLILKVTDRYREGLAELEEVQDEIRQTLAGPRYGPAIREFLTDLRADAYIEIRPGYADSSPAPGADTSWTDPARLAPVTTTRDEVLEKKKRKLLWLIPLGTKKTRAEKEDEKEAKALLKEEKKAEKRRAKQADDDDSKSDD